MINDILFELSFTVGFISVDTSKVILKQIKFFIVVNYFLGKKMFQNYLQSALSVKELFYWRKFVCIIHLENSVYKSDDYLQ